MRLESEEKSMETIKANIVQVDEKYFINIENEEHKIRIPMSEDKPNEVKNAFNRLIDRIKDGKFQIELTELGDDLFTQLGCFFTDDFVSPFFT